MTYDPPVPTNDYGPNMVGCWLVCYHFAGKGGQPCWVGVVFTDKPTDDRIRAGCELASGAHARHMATEDEPEAE